MAELVRDDVEIQRIWRMAPVGKPMRADLHEAVAGIGVVEPRQDGDLQPAVIRREMPFDPPTEVAFPDIQDEPHRAEHMRFGKFRRSNRQMIEMTFGAGSDGRRCTSFPGRQIQMGRAQRTGADAVGETFADRVDEVNSVVGRTGADGTWEFGQAYDL